MPVVANDYISSAKQMLLGATEIDFRNSASRSFYGVYHSCEDLRQKLDIPIFADINGGSHAKLIESLVGCSCHDTATNRAIKCIGYMLKQCRGIRREADYKLSDDFSISDADTAVLQAERIMMKIEGLLQSNAA